MEYTLQVIKYNNYYNRQLKLADNYVNIDSNPYWEEGIYFNFGDGVNTTQVVDDLVEDKDYCILYELGGLATLHSRWFIIDTQYQLNGQTVLTLRRDLLADFAPEVLYAKSFIEKGWLKPSNSLIFNTEQMTFNQVKREEILLKDGTECPWIVGYYTKDKVLSATAVNPNTYYDELVTVSPSAWWVMNVKTVKPTKDQTLFGYHTSASSSNMTEWALKGTDLAAKIGYSEISPKKAPYLDVSKWLSTVRMDEAMNNSVVNEFEKYYDEYCAYKGFDYTKEEILAYNNKIIKFVYEEDGTVKTEFRRISVTETTVAMNDDYITAGVKLCTDMIEDMQGAIRVHESGANVTPYPSDGKWLRVISFAEGFEITSEEVEGGSYTLSFSETHANTLDAPYDMFCLPYGSMTITADGQTFRTDKDVSLMMVTEMASASGELMDVQILPYCPIAEIKNQSYTPTDETTYDLIKKGTENVGIVFHCQRSSFTRQISIINNVPGTVPSWLMAKTDPIEIKVQDQCEMVRLNSPNYAATWEMSVAKNNGVGWFNVSATYIPINPYIKIAPEFKGLYGSNFNDNRGLILSGDFSISTVSDQWKTYQLQNKNYESIFNREIKNLDMQHKYGRMQDIAGIVTGGFQAAGTGAALGAAGGAVGMGIGAAASAVASVGAGVLDLVINDKLRDEAKSYKTDMYNFQFGNIQALPDTLSRTTAYTIDNKYFPFIEYYSATDEEKQAFKDKLTYNGMTIGVIGTFADYLGQADTYVKGQLIRLEGIGDMHIVNQIAAEMEKGIYINGNITAKL